MSTREEDAAFFGRILIFAAIAFGLWVVWQILKVIFIIVGWIVFLLLFFVLPIVVVAFACGYPVAAIANLSDRENARVSWLDVRWPALLFAIFTTLMLIVIGAPQPHMVHTDDVKKERWAEVQWPGLFMAYERFGEAINLITPEKRPVMRVQELTDDGFAYLPQPAKTKASKRKREPEIYGPPPPPGFFEADSSAMPHHSVLLVKLKQDGEFPTYDLPNLSRLLWIGLLFGAPIVFLVFAMRIVRQERFRILKVFSDLEDDHTLDKSAIESKLGGEISTLKERIVKKDKTIKDLQERVDTLVKTTADGGVASVTSGGPAVLASAPTSAEVKKPPGGALGSDFL